jgi:hypothetical protein
VNAQFGGTLFQKALKDAFNDLVNREAGKYKTADLIASFCDRCVFAFTLCIVPVVGIRVVPRRMLAEQRGCRCLCCCRVALISIA